MLIKDITVLNSNMEPLEHRNVVVKDGRFDSIGVDVVEKDPEMVIDGKNKLLMPGFYNTHCHVPMTLTRGLGEGLSLNDWLTKKMFPFEGNMTEEDCYYGALLGAMELMAGGCVSISDMYFHVQDIARALYDAGMKANICHGLSSSDPHERPESLKGWRNTVSLLNEYRDKKDDGYG